MAFYENTIVAKQDLSEKDIKNLIKKYDEIIKSSSGKVIKIEEFDYENYILLSKWMGIKPDINKFIFNIKTKIARRNNKNKTIKNLKNFSKFKSKIEKKYYKENLC